MNTAFKKYSSDSNKIFDVPGKGSPLSVTSFSGGSSPWYFAITCSIGMVASS